MLVVEDGTGLDNANSYASLEDANAYFALRDLHWSGTDTVKEMALVQASEYITARWEPVLKGSRKSLDQSLAFPRVLNQGVNVPPVGFVSTSQSSYVVNPFELSYFTGIHKQLKAAVFSYALRALNGKLMPDPETEAPIEEIETAVQGAVSKRVKYRAQSQNQYKQYFEADALMTPFLKSSKGAIR